MRLLQERLRRLEYLSVRVNGHFNRLTAEAVRTFQTDHGIQDPKPQDGEPPIEGEVAKGEVGPLTLKQLNQLPAQDKRKRNLTELYVKRNAETGLTWDTGQKGLVLQVRPSGHRAYKCVYSFKNQVRWHHIADANEIGLAEARVKAAEIMLARLDGRDPQAEKVALARQAKVPSETFAKLAASYVEGHAKKHNRSWEQADYLVRKNLLPQWGALIPAQITQEHVKERMAGIAAKVVANQTLAAASAIFSWAVKERLAELTTNPCIGVDRNFVHGSVAMLAATAFAFAH